MNSQRCFEEQRIWYRGDKPYTGIVLRPFGVLSESCSGSRAALMRSSHLRRHRICSTRSGPSSDTSSFYRAKKLTGGQQTVLP